MPNPKAVIATVIFVAILVALAAGADWVYRHPLLLILAVAAVVGTVVVLKKRTAARNRV